MRVGFAACWLAGACIAGGQVVPAPPEPLAGAKRLQDLLADPNGDLSNLAKLVVGENGGNQLFYLPTRDEPATPAKWGFNFENVRFKSADGTDLHGWFLPARGKTAKATIVFSHGNAGSVGYHLGFVMWLVEAGYNVFMYDYRGFGKSGGVVQRRGMLDDVKAAFAYVSSRADIDRGRLISYGHSLGGAKSVTALSETPVKGLQAVVIDAAFSSYREMARVMGGEVGANLVTDDLSPKDYIAKLPMVPLLVVHGTSDEVVPVAQGLQLFERAHEPKTLFEVKDGSHGDSLARDRGAFRKKMILWLAEALRS